MRAASLVPLTMQSVQVTSIPRRMYIYARLDDSLQTPFTSDSYFALNNLGNPLTVTWNNNQFFSQFTAQDVYNMSTKNGLCQSWSQFEQYTGSVICIDFGTDLGLMSDQAPGSLGNYQLQLTCQFINTNTVVAIAPTLYVVLVYEGAFDIIDGACSHNIGILSHNDVISAKENPMVTYKKVESVYGGDFFSGIKNFFSRIPGAIKSAVEHVPGLVKKIAPYAKTAFDIYKAVRGGRKKRRAKRRGGVLYGDMNGGRRRRMGAKHLRGGAFGEDPEDDNKLDEEDYAEIKAEIDKLNLPREQAINMFNEVVREFEKNKDSDDVEQLDTESD